MRKLTLGLSCHLFCINTYFLCSKKEGRYQERQIYFFLCNIELLCIFLHMASYSVHGTLIFQQASSLDLEIFCKVFINSFNKLNLVCFLQIIFRIYWLSTYIHIVFPIFKPQKLLTIAAWIIFNLWWEESLICHDFLSLHNL